MKGLCTILLACFMLFSVQEKARADQYPPIKAYTSFEVLLAQELFDSFTLQTGIPVEWVRLSSGEAVTRIESEREAPQASIWVGGVGTQHIMLEQRGLSASYDSPEVVYIPEQYRDHANHWVGLYVGPLSFCMNMLAGELDKIPMPKKWSDLIDPIYKDRISVAHPSTSGTAYNMITNIIRLFDGDEDKAFDFLVRLDQNILKYTRSGSAPGKSVAIGEITVAIGYLHDQVKLQVNGAPIEIAVPEDGAGFETASMSLLKNGPEPEVAKKLYDWILGPEAMSIFARWHVVPLSTLYKAPNTGFVFEKLNLVEQDDVWDASNKERLLARWDAEIGQFKH